MEEIQSARISNRSIPVLRYPITQLADGRQAYIGHQLGGVQGWGPNGVVRGLGTGARGEVVRSARALQLTYYLQARGSLMDRVAGQWEKAFCAELQHFSALHPKLGLYPSTSSSLRTDFQFSSVLAHRPLLASLGVCGVLAILCCSMRDCVRSKPWLGLLALLSITLSGLTAAGILNLTGATYNSTYLGIPFVMLGRSNTFHGKITNTQDTFYLFCLYVHAFIILHFSRPDLSCKVHIHFFFQNLRLLSTAKSQQQQYIKAVSNQRKGEASTQQVGATVNIAIAFLWQTACVPRLLFQYL